MTERSTVDPGAERAVFDQAVRDVLADEPGGLEANAIRRRIHAHPDHDLEIRMQDLHPWLGELVHGGPLTFDSEERRYALSSSNE